MNKTYITISNIILAFAISFTLLLFSPLDYYYSNKNDVWYDLYNILPFVSLIFLVTFVIFTTILITSLFLPHFGIQINKLLCTTMCYLLIALYIQGNFIRIPYGTIDGTPIIWSNYTFENICNIVLWLGILVIFIVLFIKLSQRHFYSFIKTSSIFILSITVFTLFVEFVIYDGSEKKIAKLSTTENEWIYSDKNNFNILLMDCLDSRVFTELLRNNESFREKTQSMTGFTYYRDTVGCYNLTDYSIPTILSGQGYCGETTYGEYINTASLESPLFSNLNSNGWDINIYSTITLPQEESSDIFSNLSALRLTPIYDKKFIKDMYMTVCFRYMPNFTKHYFYPYFFEVDANVMSEANSTVNAYDWNNVIWNNNHQEYGFSIAETPMFHFYHLQGIHAPRQYDSEFNFYQTGDNVGLEEATRMCMEIITTWIDHLKEDGLYDNSIIIIMGDHGSPEYESGNNMSQAPVLLIKGYDDNQPFHINNIPVSYFDLQDAYAYLLEGYSSNTVFDYILADQASPQDYVQTLDSLISSTDSFPESVDRIRPFYYTYMLNSMKSNSTGGPFYECYTLKKVYDSSPMLSTGVVYGEK